MTERRRTSGFQDGWLFSMLDDYFKGPIDDLSRAFKRKAGKLRDEVLCGGTRMLVWRVLRAACVIPLPELRREYKARIKKCLDRAARLTDCADYKSNILERHRQLKAYLDSGIIPLSEKAREHFLEQFKELGVHAQILLDHAEGRTQLSRQQQTALAKKLEEMADKKFRARVA